MTEWVYLVNDRSPDWGYDVTSLEFFGAQPGAEMRAWTLSRFYKDMRPGDLLWIRATAPVSAFIGLGQVATDLRPDPDGAVFGILFDDQMCRRMSAEPITGVLEKHTQVPRRLTPGEQRALHRRAGRLPKELPVRPGKVRRMQEVVARQGQSDFRAKLFDAYAGACAVTGTGVAEVLQAAHIEPYNGMPTNLVPNGLLLRADVHDLFDRGMLWISAGMRVSISPELVGSLYGELKGRKLRLPTSEACRPDPLRLAKHRRVIAGQPR
jgi:hypothetical protein